MGGAPSPLLDELGTGMGTAPFTGRDPQTKSRAQMKLANPRTIQPTAKHEAQRVINSSRDNPAVKKRNTTMKYEATSQTRKMGMLAAMIALLTIVYVFGASPYANDGTFGTLQAQGSNGAITGLTLTSDTPGTLTVSWDTTTPSAH